MKKILVFTLAAVVSFGFAGTGAWAQKKTTKKDAKSTFTLQEITVTAEKRATNAQALPSSIVAITGNNLALQGRISTQEMLEDVPNVTYRSASGQTQYADSNIAIRGIQRTQESGSDNENNPPTTAVHVDGVYQGIGGDFDLNRVEVLRGPQGTLYGRSATAGVVAFHTNNPKLDKFGGHATLELGSANLLHYEAAINVPATDYLAFRAAGNYNARDGYFNGKAGYRKVEEGRIKALLQPNDNFSALLSYTYRAEYNNGGGVTPILTGPGKIDYRGASGVLPSVTAIMTADPAKYNQAALHVNYKFDGSALTWISAYHNYDFNGAKAPVTQGPGTHQDHVVTNANWVHTEELRWASDNNGPLKWLVGANYFEHRYNSAIDSHQIAVTGMNSSNYDLYYNADMFSQQWDKTTTNWGLFTEETYKVRDNFRITAGLRYDYTKIWENEIYRINENLDAFNNTLNGTPIWTTYNTPKALRDLKFNNVTYKLRFEYNLTQSNMVYLMTATGFLPGSNVISPVFPAPITFQRLPFSQEKLTSYEAGTKNQFLNNRLRLNGAVFYLDYQGYQENTDIQSQPGPPTFATISVPVKVIGFEFESQYLITPNDRVALNAGWQDVEIKSWPDLGGTLGNAHQYAQLKKVPGVSPLTANLRYEHQFYLNDGSTLSPRIEVRYIGSYYLSQLTKYQVANTQTGGLAFDHQDSYELVNLGLTWVAANQGISVTAYGRNVFDKEYITSETQPSLAGTGDTTVTVGAPSTFGLMVNVKF